MIRVYLLPAFTENEVNSVSGIELIHDAILGATETPNVRKLIMDTTTDEHIALELVAIEVREPTQAELDLYNRCVSIFVPDPDTLRAEELLGQSPDVITMPEIWELLRIYGRRLGYRF